MFLRLKMLRFNLWVSAFFWNYNKILEVFQKTKLLSIYEYSIKQALYNSHIFKFLLGCLKERPTTSLQFSWVVKMT